MKPSALKADTDMFEYLNPDFHGFLKSYVKTTNLKTLSDKKPMTFKDFKRSKLPKCDKDVFLGDDEKSQSNYHENLYYNYHTVDENNFTGKQLLKQES